MSNLSKQAILQDISNFSKNWKIDYVEIYSAVMVISLFLILFAKFSIVMVVLPIVLIILYRFIVIQQEIINHKKDSNKIFLINHIVKNVHKNDNYIFGALIISVITLLLITMEGWLITIPLGLIYLFSIIIYKPLKIAQTVFEVDNFSLLIKQRWRKSYKIDFTTKKIIGFDQGRIVFYDNKQSMIRAYLALDEEIAKDFIAFLELNYGSEQIQILKNSVTKHWNL